MGCFLKEIKIFSSCFYRVIETLVKVWENVKNLWKHSPAARVPTAFLIVPSLHSCFYNSIETRRKCFLFRNWLLCNGDHSISWIGDIHSTKEVYLLWNHHYLLNNFWNAKKVKACFLIRSCSSVPAVHFFFAFVEKPDSPSVTIIKIRFVESRFARNLQRHENTLFLFNVRPCFVL